MNVRGEVTLSLSTCWQKVPPSFFAVVGRANVARRERRKVRDAKCILVKECAAD